MTTPTIPGSESADYFSVTVAAVDVADGTSPARLQVSHSLERMRAGVVLDLTFPEHDPRHESITLVPEVAGHLADGLAEGLKGQVAAELRGIDTVSTDHRETPVQQAVSVVEEAKRRAGRRVVTAMCLRVRAYDVRPVLPGAE